MAVILAVTVLAGGCLPPLLDPPTSGLSYGKGPLDAIREAADSATTSGPYASCGLSSTDLAAMMIVPTWFEAGGPVPSPMALSRWDNVRTRASNANLFAFGKTTGPYVEQPSGGAFFSPGIGLWQFDSAGGWDLTAADAIDTVTAANAAASTIAYRWCNAPPSKATSPQSRRQYAWGPWYGCSGTRCEDRFQQLVSAGSLNTAQDFGIDRYGGMQARSCNVAGLGTGLVCWYVNPANAQGSTGWRNGTYDPGRIDFVTPLPKPFYVIRANGREHRIWIKEDTSFDIGITASVPIGSNARTSISWEAQARLCDVTAWRGECGGVGPTGFIDAVTAGTNSVRVSGWAFDRDATAALPIHVYVGSVGSIIANGVSRPDVAAAFPGATSTAGFDTTLPAPIGPQQVCIHAIDVGGGTGNSLLGCRVVTVTGPPKGALDAAAARPGSIDVAGWSFLPGDPASAAVVTVDGEVRGTLARTVARADVVRAIPGADQVSGFTGNVPASAGRRTVCLTAGPAPVGALGCRQVEVPGGSPIGTIDAVSVRPGAVVVSGWAIDPDVAGPIDVHVYVDSVGVAVRADGSRPDVGAVFPAYGPAHGYTAEIPARGTVRVCAYGINVGIGSTTALGCRSVTVPTGSPIGWIDSAVRTGWSVTISGWTLDPDTAASIPVHIYANGVGYAITANGDRPDVGAFFTGYGPAHGFTHTIPSAAPVQICVYGIETSGTGGNRLLGCRTA